MTPAQWHQVKGLLDRTPPLIPAEHLAAAQAAFPDDPGLWDQVVAVLNAATRSIDEAALETGARRDGQGTVGHASPDESDSTTAGGRQAAVRGSAFVPGDMCGPYRVVRLIGVGGMGEVYLAEDTRTDLPGIPVHRVALKCLLGRWVNQADARYRLLNEFAAAAALGAHSHIAGALDVLDVREDLMVLVMEYVEGTTLHALVAQGPMPWRDALKVVSQVLDGLEHAHLRGIIHCDIKPSNIMVVPGGHAKILDFGLSRAARHLPASPGPMLGTAPYMPPERIVDNVLDAVGDLYSLGVTLYELLTGRRAFDADDLRAVYRQVLDHTPAPPSYFSLGLPQRIDAIVGKLTAKDSLERYQSAADVLHDVREVLEPKRLSWSEFLVRVAGGTAAALVLLVALGWLSSRAIDLPLGRTNDFVADDRRTLLMWGAMSLTAPALLMGASTLLAGAGVVVARLLLAIVPPLRVRAARIGASVRRVVSATIASPSGTWRQVILLCQGVVLLWFAFSFWPLMAAVAHFDSPGLPGTLDALAPSQTNVRENYRMVASAMVFFLAASTAVLLHARVPGVGLGGRRVAGVAGVIATGLGLVLLVFPYQVFTHAKGERVAYGAATCYLVARNQRNEGRLYCPASTGAERLRTVALEDGAVRRTGVVESVFSDVGPAR